MPRRIALLVALATLGGCDDRVINATAALTPPGEKVPPFAVRLLGGDTLSTDSLEGAPSVIAAWSTTCPGSRTALAGMESLRKDYESRGVKFVILSGDQEEQRLREFADSAQIGGNIAYIGEDLPEILSQAESAPERATDRVLFAMPSFLVVGPDGRVAARSGGYLDDTAVRAALDSLVGVGRGLEPAQTMDEAR